MTDTTRRNLLAGAGLVAAVGAAAAACGSDGTPNTGGNVDQNAGSVNDLQNQEEKLTVQPFNAVKADPEQKYPAALIKRSLELRQQQEKLLRFNTAEKLGWAYLFTNGMLIAELPVKGKISSTQSSMTTDVGIYKDPGTSGGGNVAVKVPSDDLSFGPNEGGDSGKFFFTPDGVYVFWDGPLLYLDAPLDILSNQAVLKYNHGSQPSSIAPKVS